MNEQNKIIWREFGDDARKSEFPATIKLDDGIETLHVTWDDYLIAREESIEERYQEYLKTVTGSSSDESRKHYKLSKAEMSIARTVDLGKFVMTVFADENRFYKDDYGYIREKGSNMKIDTQRNKFFMNDEKDSVGKKQTVGNPIEYLQMLGFDFVTSVTILLQFNQGQDVKAYFKKENDDNVLSDDNAFRFYMQWQTT